MPLCFWCDTEQSWTPQADPVPDGPPNARYAPCSGCRETMASGIVMLEVSDEEVASAQVGLYLGGGRIVYPTGNWAVVSREFMEQFQPEFAQMLDRYDFCTCSAGVWDLMGLER